MTDQRFSKNKAEYFTLDFANVTEKGLKKLIDAFKKYDQPIAEVEATNRITKKDRLSIKKALLRFANGQSITISVGDQGDVIETKLNTAIVPVKALDSIDGYAREVSAKLVANQARWDKSVAAKAIKKVVPTDTDKKPAGRSIQARLIQAKADKEASQANIDALQSKLNDLQNSGAESTSELAALRKQLDQERGTTNELIQQIEALGGEV